MTNILYWELGLRAAVIDKEKGRGPSPKKIMITLNMVSMKHYLLDTHYNSGEKSYLWRVLGEAIKIA